MLLAEHNILNKGFAYVTARRVIMSITQIRVKRP